EPLRSLCPRPPTLLPVSACGGRRQFQPGRDVSRPITCLLSPNGGERHRRPLTGAPPRSLKYADRPRRQHQVAKPDSVRHLQSRLECSPVSTLAELSRELPSRRGRYPCATGPLTPRPCGG